MMLEPLTASRMASFMQCPRQHYWRYEVGLRRLEDSAPLSFGRAWHAALEARAQGADLDGQMQAAFSAASVDELQVATLGGLLAGYNGRYGGDAAAAGAREEVAFDLDIDGSRRFRAAGRIDRLVPDGDAWTLVEYKTTSDSLDSGSDYWLRLRANPQVWQYVDAARRLGYNVTRVSYDVTRKPSIRPKEVGKGPEKHLECGEEYAARLFADTKERPDFYFARREIAVLDGDLAEFLDQRVQIGRMILDRRRQGATHAAWPRNISEIVCRGCQYADWCLCGIVPDVARPPAGFIVSGEKFPELAQESAEQKEAQQ